MDFFVLLNHIFLLAVYGAFICIPLMLVFKMVSTMIRSARRATTRAFKN